MGRLLRKRPTDKKKKEKANTSFEEKTVAKKEDKKPSFITEKLAGKVKLSQHDEKNNLFQKAVRFLTEVKIELKKVVWPTKKQAGGSAAVVIIFVMIIGLFLGIVDSALSFFVRIILR